MSMIGEQVADLREKALIFENSGCATDGIVKTFRKAADTIEQLSEKLAINSQPPADQWIPVTYHEATEEEKEAYGEFPYMLDCKLPDDGEEILVCTKSGCVWTDTFFNDDGCYLDGGYDFTELAAWMPLPEPYKEP